jgi:DNA-binding transcriptional regulator LsrR (DeoR family)
VVLAAGGEHKIAAIRAALRAVDTNVLITDSATAEALLATE